MAIFKCKMCGGELNVTEGATVVECDYCGSKQTLPRLDDNMRANLYDRANHFRRNNEYDKAMGIYNRILDEDKTDAEAYWSIVLCTYGIEYVEDPVSHKRVPTVNRTQYTSIFDDANYKAAIEYADSFQKGIYEEEAKAINEIQKGILEISQKEEPFDVFICYKETDDAGRRTPDSVLANDLYHQLIQEGFRVFFSRITLEDKLGTAYEPYIFAALNSAKVMVVLGTKPENFNAVWVKNEWSRYLALIRNGEKKMLIPAYRDMDPYDLPEEFSHLQAQDMSKLGFMQDLIRGIKKIAGADPGTGVSAVSGQATSVPETQMPPVAPLLKRGFMFCEDGNWESADEYFERVLDQDPENVQAYLGKLMAETHARRPKSLKNLKEPFADSLNYKKVKRFDAGELTAKLDEYNEIIRANKKKRLEEERANEIKRREQEKEKEEKKRAREQKKKEEERQRELNEFLDGIDEKKPGDTVRFGGLNWLVLRREFNLSMLFLNDRVLKSNPWDRWADSPIREELNNSFIDEQFLPDEKKMIINTETKESFNEEIIDDKLFLLDLLGVLVLVDPLLKPGDRWFDDFLEVGGHSAISRLYNDFTLTTAKAGNSYRIHPVMWVNTADTDDPLAFWKLTIENETQELLSQIHTIEKEIKEAGMFDRKKKNELTEKKRPLSEEYTRLMNKLRKGFNPLFEKNQ